MRNKPNLILADLKHLFHIEGKNVLVYPGMERKEDTFEETVKTTLLTPFLIKAIVKDFSPAGLRWKEYGLQEIGAKQLIVERKHIDVLRVASKLDIDGESYTIFKDAVSSRMQIWERAGFALIIVEKK